MKKKVILILTAITVFASSVIANQCTIAAAELNNESSEMEVANKLDSAAQELQDEAPEYDVWLSDTIVSGLSMNGTTYGDSMYKLFKEMQEPIYAELGGLILEDIPLMSVSSVWHDVVKRDFYDNQKLIYEALLMDYIKYENTTNAASFDTSQIDRANSYLIKIFNELTKKYLAEGVQNWSPEQFMDMSVEDAVKSFEGVETMQKTVKTVQSAAKSTKQLISIMAEFSALEDIKQEKIQLIKKARDAAKGFENPNNDFISACDEIAGQMESTAIDVNYLITKGASAGMEKLIDKVWSGLAEKNVVLKSIDLGSGAMDILFNTSEASSDNLKLSLLYTMDCYLKTGLNQASMEYLENKSDNDLAQTFNGCFEGYVEFQMYGNKVAKSWIGSVTDGGVLNHAFSYIFYRENLKNASELKSLCDSQSKTRGQILSILEKYQKIYSGQYMKDEYKQAMSVPIMPTPTVDPKDYNISEGITSPNPVEDSGKCTDSVYWKIFEDKTLVIYGNGDIENYDYIYRNYAIKKVVVSEGITGLCVGFCSGLHSLESVILPEGITEINRNAFWYCDKLTNITLPTGLTAIDDHAFEACYALKTVTLPNGVITIGDGAFLDCTGLESITIPDGVTKLGETTFENCKKLKSIKLGSGLKNIGRRAFRACTGLENITIPGNVENIEWQAFDGCNNLKKINLSKGLNKIEGEAFADCTSLESITLPNGLSTIESESFVGCTSLKNISLPKGLITIGEEAFRDCTGLESIEIQEGIESLERSTFEGCSNLKTVTLPQGLTNIKSNVFLGCTGLKEIILPNGLTEIGNTAFCACDGLEKITVPDSVIKIGDGSFADCINLKYIIIPNSVKQIGYSAFAGCDNLESITIQNKETEIDIKAFKDCPKLSIYGYAGSSAEAYAKKYSIPFITLKLVTEGWKKDAKDWWYQNSDGSYPKNQWKKIGKEWYHFDTNGYMQTGWLKLDSFWYYLKDTGAMAKDEWVDNGKSYVDADGKYVPGKVKYTEGWKKDAKGWWYQNSDGSYPKNQWKKIKGDWYHFDTSGYMQTGWLKIDNIWYYFKTSGAMAKDEWVDNGKSYVDADGKYVPGKKKYTEGWKKNAKGWWYQEKDGSYPKSKWKQISGKWYYFDANGYMQTGWLKLGNIWYYLKDSGAMAENEWVENGKYFVDANGKYIAGKKA